MSKEQKRKPGRPKKHEQTMTAQQFAAAQKKIGLDNVNMAKLIGYGSSIRVNEIKLGTRKVQPVVERFILLLMALGETDRNLVIGYFLSGNKGELRITCM